jgi:hypothetical protein
MIWTFNQSGTYPGAKDTYAGVRVEVDDATNEVVSVTPLAVHSEFEPEPKIVLNLLVTGDAAGAIAEFGNVAAAATDTTNTPDDMASAEAQP